MDDVAVRALDRPTDDVGWARCRALAFLDTAYFDDVQRVPTELPDDAIRLAATRSDSVVGVIDVTIDEADPTAATIDTIAVHPDHRRAGVGRLLLTAASRALDERGNVMLDAWTRDDPAANVWYQATGFVETFRYLHVYASTDEEIERSVSARSGLTPVHAFFHAAIDHEDELRRAYRRVHVCRRYQLARPRNPS